MSSVEGFLKTTVDVLTDECDARGLRTPQQVSTFVTQALTVGFGANHRAPVSEIVAKVFQNVNTGIKNLPSELPIEFAPPNFETQEVYDRVVEISKALGKKYHEDGVMPKVDQIQRDIQVKLGITDDTGDLLRLAQDEDRHILAKASTILMNAFSTNPVGLGDTGLEEMYEEVNNAIYKGGE